jgi:hypothetical protein
MRGALAGAAATAPMTAVMRRHRTLKAVLLPTREDV